MLTNTSESDKLPLFALPSMLRNLSQLGRSGVLHIGYKGSFLFLEMSDGSIERVLIYDDLLIDFVVEKLLHANLIRKNVAEIIISSGMNLGEFAEFMVFESYAAAAEVNFLLLRFAKEVLFNVLDSNEGSLDFNIRTEILSNVESTAFSLLIGKTPGQLFLDYWEYASAIEELKSEGGYFIVGNRSSFNILYSPSESKLIKQAESGAYLQVLLESIFQVKEEVVETLLRLTKSGILIPEVPVSLQEEENKNVPDEDVKVVDVSTASHVGKDAAPDLVERFLPFIISALVFKFVFEFRTIIYLIENTFAN